MRSTWLGLLLLAAAGGCDTVNNYYGSNPDLAGGGTTGGGGCTPNAKECVGDHLARVCPADGAGWLAVPCGFGETCDQGECGVDVTTVNCFPSDNFCTGDTTALVCNDNGVGFKMKTCPANTHCIGAGDCEGSCVIGSSVCFDAHTVLKCMDGFTLTPVSCASGEACSDTAGGVCLKAQCEPGACTAVCGNKAADPTNTDPAFFSTCSDTDFGWQWVSFGCPSPTECDSTSACNAQFLGDSCTTECTENAVRCTADLTGQQTCVNGKWDAVTACGTGKVCVFDASFKDLGCGDTICGQDPVEAQPNQSGYCVLENGVSKLRACDSTGNLVPIGRLTTCPTGSTCITDNEAFEDPNVNQKPGRCSFECKMGDSRCGGPDGESVQNCGPNGLWSSTTTSCITDDIDSECRDFQSPDGRPRAVCGVCNPGNTRCTDMTGASVDLDDSAFIETCGTDGKWGSPQACVASHCDTPPGLLGLFGPDKACVALCVPGHTMCLGNGPPSPSPIPLLFGLKSQGTCTADGRPDPSPMACAAGTACRTGPNRTNAYGCVTCVGTENEAGVPDTRCKPAAGVNDVVQVCNATNDGWTDSQTCSSANGTGCVPMDDPRDANPETCYLTDSEIKASDPSDPTLGCGIIGDDVVSCAGRPDCCDSYCYEATTAEPAACSF